MMSNVTSWPPDHGWIPRWISVSTLSVFGSRVIPAEPEKDERWKASSLPARKSAAADISLVPDHGASPEPAASAQAPQARAALNREAGVAPIRMPTRRTS
jgi:hypothetical protein